MNTRNDGPVAGGKWAGLLFALALVAFVLESQLTQVWQSWTELINVLLKEAVSSTSRQISASVSPTLYCESGLP